MKQTENNEIDLLLRGLARHERAGSVVPGDHSAMHLDADELNAYAEQALPPGARARYTSHLADCASCRKIVSELTSASGANVTEHSVSQKSPAGLRQRLGALFSPGVLRYAVPALALFAFIAIGLVVIRQQDRSGFVAQNQPSTSRDAILETEQADAPAEPAESVAAVEERQTSESQASARVRKNQAKAGERNETSNTPAAADSVTDTSDKNTSPGKAGGVVASPSYAPEPAPRSAPKSQTTHTESRTEVARQKEEADKKDEPAREQEGTRARTDNTQNEVARTASGAATMHRQGQDRLSKLEAKRASGAGEKAKDDEVELRTVSGRRFRRQRGVWIDTAYHPSTATTNVVRGSEQFRALAADEPGIRSIAAQLPGEVIVVWKGRAYRIR
jgi:hypothetical protein